MSWVELHRAVSFQAFVIALDTDLFETRMMLQRYPVLFRSGYRQKERETLVSNADTTTSWCQHHLRWFLEHAGFDFDKALNN